MTLEQAIKAATHVDNLQECKSLEEIADYLGLSPQHVIERAALRHAHNLAIEQAAKVNDAYKVEGRDLEENEGRFIDDALNKCSERIRTLKLNNESKKDD